MGLGGRLDATNVTEKALTIVTPVAMDHEAFLGDTLAAIAGEKAGILARRTPCVVGPQADEALEVIEARAARLGAPLQIHGQHWHVREERGRLVFEDERGLLDLPLPSLIGAHQVQNAGTALAALRALGDGDPEAAMRADWPARLQTLRRGPLPEMAPAADLRLDGGHNPAAGAALAESLGRLPKRPTHLICGMLRTKDAAGYMAPLARVAESLTAVPIAGEPATLSAKETAAAARRAGFAAVARADTVAEALRGIVADAPSARVLICGSLYLAGRVLRENG